MTRKPVDVWFKMSDDPEEELAEYEANTYRDGDGFVIEWYHNDVGLVTSVYCNTYTAVTNWYLTNGYEDFTDYGDPDAWDEATPDEMMEQAKAEAEFYKARRLIELGLTQSVSGDTVEDD